MSGGTATTSFRTILEKPLNQLTEDDISQLTREDCRNYLKEKGMRRPSWNKSQAIQQVISLKALLEPNDDSGAGVLRKIVGPPHAAAPRPASNSTDSAKEASAEAPGTKSAEEPAPGPEKEPLKPVRQDRPAEPAAVKVTSPAEPAVKAIAPSKNQCATKASVSQMTIFYCGKVNVYDGVLPDKAQKIMHLAARPNHLPLDSQYSGTAAASSLRCQFQIAGDKDGPFPPNATIPQAMQTDGIADYTQLYWDKDGQASRKVLLQRYREKRKDRDRVKIKKNMGPTSSLEVCFNHPLGRHTSNGNSSRSSTGSPPQQPGLLQIADNQTKFRCLPVDLNENDILEC
ncbi:protein TIFY 4B-like isoform X2 [Argentina anserina]|uniref:protein TIFY 4B-like isoform X2 n=1 Tax=Argentina anserina TaxID=57926 RepID=UPI0021762F0C|nr:protein TIFY 4B-like isoform X2 [Potentilla anserina]